MRVITFTDYVPIPRYDATPWTQVDIMESSTSEGPWIFLENQPILPVDADPANPGSRSFTTELATLTNGWYKLIFKDATGDDQNPTQPIQNLESGAALYTPTIAQVGALIRTRTKDDAGNELGTFTASTRPTSTQVDVLARRGASVLSYLVNSPIPENLLEEASDLAALRAAMLVELSYFPEQIASQRSPYNELKALWDAAIGTPDKPGPFIKAVDESLVEEGEVVTPGEPDFAFPENKGGLIGWETRM